MCSKNCSIFPAAILRNFHMDCTLGKGGFGDVRLLINKFTASKYALKTIKFNHQFLKGKAIKEATVLQHIDHPCIVRLYDWWVTDHHLFILLEYMVGGDLAALLRSRSYLSELQTKLTLYQLGLAVEYLHDRTIIHRDIKPANVLLKNDSEDTLVKLTDFGVSKIQEFDKSLKTYVGTRSYMAPEVLFNPGAEYTNKVDIWSLGVILWECKLVVYLMSITVVLIFFICVIKCCVMKMAAGNVEMHDSLFSLTGKRPKAYQTTCIECYPPVPVFAARMLALDPNDRMSIREMLAQLWFQDESVQCRVCELLTWCHEESQLGVPRELKKCGNEEFYFVSPVPRTGDRLPSYSKQRDLLAASSTSEEEATDSSKDSSDQLDLDEDSISSVSTSSLEAAREDTSSHTDSSVDSSCSTGDSDISASSDEEFSSISSSDITNSDEETYNGSELNSLSSITDSDNTALGYQVQH